MELWAAIDLLKGNAVTLVQGDPKKRTIWKEEPLELAARWESEGADGLHIVDLDGAFETGSNWETVDRIVKRAKIPAQVGGGLRSREKVEQLLRSGVARVVLGTLAHRDGRALESLLRECGSGKIVVATDYRGGRVVSKGWREKEDVTIMEAVKRFEEMGVECILATAVDNDGIGKGPDVATLRKICNSTSMKVLASGGITSLQDVGDLRRAGAHGAVLGRALYEGTISLREAR